MHVQDEINGLQQLFRNIDADNSGTITIDELRAALTSCNGKMSVRATSIRCVWDGAHASEDLCTHRNFSQGLSCCLCCSHGNGLLLNLDGVW